MRIRIDVACRAAHQAACADETGRVLWGGHRFRTTPQDLAGLWARVPKAAAEVTVVMEPTRNAWVPLAAQFRRHGATVVMVPSEQASDLRAYQSKHAKWDRIDAELLARLLVLHPDGLHPEASKVPGDALKRAVKLRSSLVHRRTTAMARLDALLEIMGPAWIDAIGSDMTQTAFRFLARYANPHQVKRLGRSRLARWFQHHTGKAWGERRADAVVSAERPRSSCGDPTGWTGNRSPLTSPGAASDHRHPDRFHVAVAGLRQPGRLTGQSGSGRSDGVDRI